MTAQGSGEVTRREILSQPRVWAEVLERLSRGGDGLPDAFPGGRGLFIGAGTSLYLARTLAHLGEALSGRPLRAVPPSDLLVCPEDHVTGGDVWAVGISRSGTTTETVRALAVMRERYHFPTMALSCSPDGDMGRYAERILAVEEAVEDSVVMTRSFTTMLMAFTRWMLRVTGHGELLDAQRLLPAAGERLFAGAADAVAEAMDRFRPEHIVTFGQGAYYGLACETALKVKEMALLASEPFHTLEYRHGPKSIAGPNTLVIALLSGRGGALEPDVLREVKELGAKVWAITESGEALTDRHADLVTALDSGLPETVRLPLVMPLLQLYGLELALSRGMDPDSPKNLTQVVTL